MSKLVHNGQAFSGVTVVAADTADSFKVFGGTLGYILRKESSVSAVVELGGVRQIDKLNTLAINFGDVVYWDDTNKEVNKTASGNTECGVAVQTAASTDEKINILLNGVPQLNPPL